ncbi:MAG: hypothetical protein R2873_13295 [Caldilineaceae bacterium]
MRSTSICQIRRSVEQIQAPPGWQSQPITSTTPTGGEQIVGIWFVTEKKDAMVTCQPVGFLREVEALEHFIKIYLTDKNTTSSGRLKHGTPLRPRRYDAFGPNEMAAWLTHEIGSSLSVDSWCVVRGACQY